MGATTYVTPAFVDAEAARIETDHRHDPEAQHGAADDLAVTVLRAIAEGRSLDPRACAATVASLFDRHAGEWWYA